VTGVEGITQWWPAASNSCLLACTGIDVPLAGSLVLTSSLDVDRRFDARCLLLYDHSLQITIAVIDVTMPHKTTAFFYVFGGTATRTLSQ
jgi:hypothetical protein